MTQPNPNDAQAEAVFAFDFIFVFPPALFEDPKIGSALADAGLVCDARTNRMPVFRNQVARIALAEAQDRVKEAMWDAGWALLDESDSLEDGAHAKRLSRLADTIRDKISSEREGKISRRVRRIGLKQLHAFEVERLKGRAMDPCALKDANGFAENAAEASVRLEMWEAQTLIQMADRLRGAPASS
ncbi:MAG: hypothetical protein AAGG56_00215 [Pseudomonadota bacterium]